MHAPRNEQQENFELLFNLIDTSGSGKIGKDELKAANNQYCTHTVSGIDRAATDGPRHRHHDKPLGVDGEGQHLEGLAVGSDEQPALGVNRAFNFD